MRRALCIRLPNGFPRPLLPKPGAPDERYLADDLATARAAWGKLAHWCRRYSPLVGLEESAAEFPEEWQRVDSLVCDITGCAHLFGGEERMVRQIVRDLQRLGLTAHVAIADTIGAAWAAAHFDPSLRISSHVSSRPAIIPPGKQADALGPLPVEALRLPDRSVAILRDLGLETVAQLTALPRATLPSRFGPEILRRLDQALGTRGELIIPARQIEPAEVRWGSEHPVEDRLAIEGVLRRVVNRLLRRLQSRNEGVLKLLVELQSPGCEPTRFCVGAVRPLVGKQLHELVRLRLERLRLEAGIVGIRVCVEATATLECIQRDLFDEGGLHDVRRELDSLLNRLSSRLGEAAVLRPELDPDFQPERAVRYRPVVESTSGRPGFAPPSGKKRKPKEEAEKPLLQAVRYRPLRLLTNPVPVVVWSVVPDGPPIRLCWRNADRQIVRCDGPERIETGWWRGRSVCRDYFRVDTDDGQRLWLFRTPDERTWFVHGEF